MSRWPMLLAATLLLLGGCWRVVEAGGLDTLAATLLSAGLVVLGVWVRDETGNKQ